MIGRKIIQIAATSSGDEEERTADLFALCDDGTVWRWWDIGAQCRWNMLEPIPQTKVRFLESGEKA